MRTLVLTQVAPSPGDAGPRIKTYFALRTLAERHDVEVLTYVRDDAEAAAARRLEEFCAHVCTVDLRRNKLFEPYHALRGWGSGTPFLVRRDYRAAFARAVQARLRTVPIDVLHADQLSMAQYLPLAGRARTVFDAHNAVHELVRRLAPRQPTPVHRAGAEIEWRMLRRFEGSWTKRADLALAVSQRDAASLVAAAGGGVDVGIVPIGVEARERQPFPARPENHTLLSVATMHYPPNAEALRWFRDAIWPLISAQHATARVDVVGPRPPEDLRAWGISDERVVVHGFVDDLDALYRRAAVFIVPLLSGSGVRVKVLEALALGLPVVSTTVGIDGLDVRHGEHLLVADDPLEFAAAVQRLLESPELRARLGAAGRLRVLERYDWRVCCRPLIDAYDQLAVPRDGRPSLALSST